METTNEGRGPHSLDDLEILTGQLCERWKGGKPAVSTKWFWGSGVTNSIWWWQKDSLMEGVLERKSVGIMQGDHEPEWEKKNVHHTGN